MSNDDELERRLRDELSAQARWEPDAGVARQRALGAARAGRVPMWSLVAAASVTVVALVAVPLVLRGRTTHKVGSTQPAATVFESPSADPTITPEPASTATFTPPDDPNCEFTTNPDGSGQGVCIQPVPTALASTVHPHPSPTASPAECNATGTCSRPTGTPGGPVVVSNDDNGSTVHLTVGQQLHVALAGGWTAPAEGDNAVLHRLGSYSSPDFSSAKADFEAVRPGATDVTSSSDAACFDATPPCRMPTQLWTLHVIVD